MMFEHILIPLDGSRLAEAALPVAAFFAVKSKAQVTLVHVIEEDAPDTIHGERHLRDVNEAEAYLKKISTEFFPADAEVDYHVHSDSVRDVAASITEHVGDFETDLVVMCTHGRGGVHDFLFGSIAQKVVASCRTPLLVVRPSNDCELSAFTVKKMIAPLDGNPEHERVLPVVAKIARTCEAEVELLTVVPTFSTVSGSWTVTARSLPGTTSELLEISEEEAADYLESLKKRLKDEGIGVAVNVLRGEAAGAISERARLIKADLIALATHGKTGTDAFWSGSLTPKVSKHCATPLLLVPVHSRERLDS
jgi:nucleotide-binding universal stress UspA family protein